MSRNKEKTRKKILNASWHLMEKQNGRDVQMSDIAHLAGISRQALYLHFKSRTELMIATIEHVDEVKGLDERLKGFQNAKEGIELLDALADVWCNYIPEIYGIARALLKSADNDEAAAAAWSNSMNCLREISTQTIETLHNEGKLTPSLSPGEAVEILLTLISIQNWEQLVREAGYTTERYVNWMKMILKRTFLKDDKQELY
jgi:AcrR family transcriptional regulator